MMQGMQNWCSVSTGGGGVGREVEVGLGGREHISLWLIHTDVWQKPSQHCKVIILQLK